MSKKQKKIAIIAGGIAAVLVIVGLSAALVGYNPFAALIQTPTTSNSTFTLISSVDGEDVSDFVEISIWVPDDDAEFDETEDIYTWSNFEEEESSKDAADVSIDLSEIEYAWLEIDPDGDAVFMNNHHLLIGGANYHYSYYVYDLSTDVNFGAVNETGGITWGNYTVPDGDTDGSYPYGMGGYSAMTGAIMTGLIDANITITLDVPRFTPNGTHVGTNWDIEQADYDEFSQAEIDFTHDEGNWQCQAPQYIPASDLEKEGDDGLEGLTNAFCIQWTFNTTVSTTDAAVTQINMTYLSSDYYDAEVVIDGTYIYLIFIDVLDFSAGPVSVEIEYQEESDIYATNVISGRLDVPRDEDALGTFTPYSPIGM